MDFQIVLPGKTIAGKGAISRAGLEKYGRKPLIVTGKYTAKSPAAAELLKYAPDGVVFDGITGEPTVEMINAGVAAYHANSCDHVIGIGGGSALDSAKAVAAMAVLGGSIAEYMGREIDGEFPPLVLIPTTAGTGSEATKFTIITDTEKDIKMLLKGDKLLPDLAVLDYSYTLSSPKTVTAATGMDALTHAIESFTSRRANPITDTFALSALKRIFANLPTAYNKPDDENAREQMLLAAYEAGVCINNASVTIVHGMSRPIGALFHVPHGISNAMLDIKCLGFAAQGAPEKFAAAARAIGVSDNKDDKAAAQDFLDALSKLCAEVGIPTLAEYGIDREKFFAAMDKMADDALASGSPANTIREVTKQDILDIYASLWDSK
ncbi:MAG: iron-containing alcohol dehydrogenase [Oscillospiraceae bacterium]|nr:iron-containing alcohol dehydrogenase [Oscillospiraceae bacterium]